ncbi:MAG: ATP-binding protein [Flavobacteriales bacterium]
MDRWVSDSGSGILAEELSTIFGNGRTKPSNKAERQGLGLAIVKTFVATHGGLVHAGRCRTSGLLSTLHCLGARRTLN